MTFGAILSVPCRLLYVLEFRFLDMVMAALVISLINSLDK